VVEESKEEYKLKQRGKKGNIKELMELTKLRSKWIHKD